MIETLEDIEGGILIVKHKLDSTPSKKGIKVDNFKILGELLKYMQKLTLFFNKLQTQKTAAIIYFNFHSIHDILFTDIQLILKEEIQDEQIYTNFVE